MSDRVALSNAIEDAGIERDKAEHIASVIVDLIHDNVTTKADLQAVETSLKAEIRNVDVVWAEIRNVDTRLSAFDARLTAVGTRLTAEIQDAEMRLAAEVARIGGRTLIRLSGVLVVLLVVLLGILFAALKWHW
jgi:hypothetical protein